jgi:RNA polymerase sigma-70 factor, ECF subfamily
VTSTPPKAAGPGSSLAPDLPDDADLAAACASGDQEAIAALDARLPALLRPVLARLGVARSDDDEILQRVRVALFTAGPSGQSALADYSGRGSLRAYLRAIAVKLALKKIEREERAAGDPIEEILAGGDDSPELAVLKARCRGELRAAFAVAIEELDERQRTLLRQHHVDGLSIDVLARLHRVHRATAARWVASARAALLRGVRRYFAGPTGLDRAELDSLVALVRSRLDLSLSRLLPPTG